MDDLQHSDHILRAEKGEMLLVSEAVSGVNMNAGGRINYAPGDRLRVEISHGGLLWCLDMKARSVTFSREEMLCLDRG